MPEYWEERLETAKNYIKQLKIHPKNKDYILSLINHLSAEGLTKTRQVKYVYAIGTLSRKITKDFATVTKKDAEKLISDINNSNEYTEWTKRDFKIVFKRLIKWIREEEGQIFEKKQYPLEVSWINTTMKRKQIRKYAKQLLTIDDIKELANHTDNLRDKCFILLLYESGARISELLGIKIKDIEVDQYGAKITLYGKTGERIIRVIASAPSISAWLNQHPKRTDTNSILFCAIGNSKRGENLDSHTYRKMLKVTAEKAGIKKPVNPHHFRHCRASELSNKLTESQLCNYMGWITGSREAATYIHTKAADVDKAVLAMHGLIEKDEDKDKFQTVKCPRCTVDNDPGAKFCKGCSLGLDEKTVMEYDQKIHSDFDEMKKRIKTLEEALYRIAGDHLRQPIEWVKDREPK
jgi:integrase/recombinase XerD